VVSAFELFTQNIIDLRARSERREKRRGLSYLP
jgi:hypothetical protein